MKHSTLALLLLASACGGPSKPATSPSNTASPTTTEPSLEQRILDAVLASQRPLPAETHKDDECGGAPTLGALVKAELDKRKEPVVAKCSEGEPPYQCYVIIGPDDPNPDPSNESWKPTQFSVVWHAANSDGTQMLPDSMLECRYQ